MRAQQETSGPALWQRRLYLPAYRYADAAHLVQTTPQTVSRWCRGREAPRHHLRQVSATSAPRLLSYLELVEVAFVTDFRRLGLRLNSVRRAHAYLRKTFEAEYPFARLEIKTHGASALAQYVEHANSEALGRMIAHGPGAQLVWPDAIGQRFEQFDYERGLAVRWHPRGRAVPILVDPRIAFGAPIVEETGIATWIVRERYEAGEAIPEIEDDFGVNRDQVVAALVFEGIEPPAA